MFQISDIRNASFNDWVLPLHLLNDDIGEVNGKLIVILKAGEVGCQSAVSTVQIRDS